MSKKFIIGVAAIILAGLGVAAFLLQDNDYATKPLSTKQLAKERAKIAVQSGQTDLPTQAALVPLKMSHSVRLAVGGLGLTDDEKNRQLGDLITVELTGAKGFDLVERESLAKILQELNLSWSGLVRAKDAVRVGKLLKVEWFLLGTETKINAANSIVVRVVDARTGVIRDAEVFLADKPPQQLASELVVFLQQVRENAANAKLRICLAIGAFEDLSVSSRQADFPNQLRGYLTAAYRSSSVTLLEREYVETLLQEVHLDMAGLTEESWNNSPPAMQSAYWLVSGQYQSYETTNFQVELNLEIQRAFGKSWQHSLRALPGEPIGRQTKSAIDTVMNQNSELIYPTRRTEARMQLEIGRQLGGLDASDLVISSGNWMQIWQKDPQFIARRKRKIEDAVRAFETVLLLEPTNRLAKVCLAMCFRHTDIMRIDEACGFYREIIDEPMQDKWSGVAQGALVETFGWYAPEQKLAWLQSAAAHATNQIAVAFYQQRAHLAEQDVVMNSGDSSKAEDLAEERLFEAIRSADNYFNNKLGSEYRDHFGMRDYLDTISRNTTNAALKLAALLPKMKKVAPDLEAYLVTSVLSFQPGTNNSVVAEFQAVLNKSIEHPNPDLNPGQLWADMGEIYYWCFGKANYPLAVQLMEGRQHVAAKGYVDFRDWEKIELAYAYLAVARWQDALNIFESFTNRPVQARSSGPWGEAFKPILTDKMAAFCLKQLGTVVAEVPRKVDMGKPILCLCAPSAFFADDSGLWIGIGGRLLHTDFELRTNLDIKLPMNEMHPISVLCLTATSVWVGTAGDGLIEFDKVSHQCRHLSENDGLMMNDIASLESAGDSLWIGYGSTTGGGLGKMDLTSRKLSSFMSSLNGNSAVGIETPPRGQIKKIVAGEGGDVWLSVAGTVRQFHVSRGAWETLPNEQGNWASCFAADSQHLVLGMGITLVEIEISTRQALAGSTNEIKKQTFAVSLAEDRRLQEETRTNGLHQWVSASSVGSVRPKGVLAIQNLRAHNWQNLEDADGIPNPPSTMTLDGDNLWVGGEGAIALVDLKQNKVKKFCHIKAESVDRIQIAGGYVWAQFDWHLYRVPLSALQ